MSLVKMSTLQLGQSATASNNFHVRNLLDGMLRFSRGNAGGAATDVMRINADNSVEFLSGISGAGVFGSGQAWVSVSRSLNTVYTNTTGRTILVHVQAGPTSAANVALLVNTNGLTIVSPYVAASSFTSVIAAVSPGATYSVTNSNGSAPINFWVEYR